MKATLTYSVSNNCVRIDCVENIDFTPLVDEIINWLAPDVNDNNEFTGYVGNLEHMLTHFAYHHFGHIDWTVEIGQERNR